MSLPVTFNDSAAKLSIEAYVVHKSTEFLREALLNAQRTVQAFRAENWRLRQENFEVHSVCGEALINGDKLIEQRDNARAALEECQKLNALLRTQLEEGNKYWEWQLATESQIRCKELAELCRVERERDNAQAALAECQKLNATLRGDIIHADAHAALMTEKLDDKIRQIDRIKESWNAVFEEKERLIKQLTAITAERDALERINDAITDIGVYPAKIIGGPNAYEERTQWQEGWNAFSTKLHRVNVEAHNKEKETK